jgi:hypothetical protein
MNKKEQKAFDDLKEQLRIAKAMRFTEDVPEDVPIPKEWKELAKGWLFNAYRWKSYANPTAVDKACSSTTGHDFGSDTKTSTQGPKPLFSTKLRALKAMRRAIELEYAKSLADLDKLIEEESV